MDKKGQITTEFTFTMVIVLIMTFSLIMTFRWVGYEFGWRRVDHDQRLMMDVEEDYIVNTCLRWQGADCVEWLANQGPIEQIDPYFHRPAQINAAWGL